MLLFRPVGLREMELIAGSGYREYPPRLPAQPIFYPVVTREYARSIVTSWNSKESEAGHCGFVTEFDIDDDFVRRYPVQQLGGGPAFRELWVPSEELAEFNARIIGSIRVIESVYGEGFTGERDPLSGLPTSVVRAGEQRSGGDDAGSP
ncbi:hypothetical protein [Zavarzinella formosa]|uniref:hypothetical protein n=1 Tax=Zavarzinella formosa TaxID=360055 RepID=UPI0002EED2C9|nr:hypothetical protein [Zavarzinella formosa]